MVIRWTHNTSYHGNKTLRTRKFPHVVNLEYKFPRKRCEHGGKQLFFSFLHSKEVCKSFSHIASSQSILWAYEFVYLSHFTDHKK